MRFTPLLAEVVGVDPERRAVGILVAYLGDSSLPQERGRDQRRSGILELSADFRMQQHPIGARLELKVGIEGRPLQLVGFPRVSPRSVEIDVAQRPQRELALIIHPQAVASGVARVFGLGRAFSRP